MLGALVSLVTGYLQAKALAKVGGKLADYVDDWFRLIASVLITSFVTFTGMWGLTGIGMYLKGTNVWACLVFGFLTGLLTTALVVYNLWTRNPLTKGIAIAVPSQLAAKAIEQDVTITERT
jgi:hypothetical protein